MKKIISIGLVLMMLFSFIVPASAATLTSRTKYPIIYFRGNSESIVDEDGNVVYDFDVDADTITEMAKVILPYFLKGYITDDFDEYYKVFGDEMAKLYDRCMLDGDGNPRYGTGISEHEKRNNQIEMSTNYVGADGTFDINSYDFANDWRLDPLETVDAIDEYIDGVLKATGKDKVCLICKCLGGDLILAYLAKYGTEKIHAVCFGSTVAFGGDLVNDTFSGHIVIDGESINRFAGDEFLGGLLSGMDKTIVEVLKETINLANATGTLAGASDAFMDGLYKKLYQGLVPALATSTYATWPGYWTMVTADRYEETKAFVFGDETSEKYQYYKGLIAKLDNYDVQVRQRIPEILKNAEVDGVNICIVAKYGFQMPPVIESYDEQGDVWTTVRYASLGATVSKIGETLSEEYIQSRKELGLEKYISPDKQVDASTCVFPEYTWFIKNAVHDDWTKEEDMIITTVCNSDERLTVDSIEGRPRFLVYDRENDTVAPMATENCNTETYDVKQNGEKDESRLNSSLKALFSWLKAIFEFIKNLFTK